MKSLNGTVSIMDMLLTEVNRLEADPDYVKQMKDHINAMCIITLLQAKGPKVVQKSKDLLVKSQ